MTSEEKGTFSVVLASIVANLMLSLLFCQKLFIIIEKEIV